MATEGLTADIGPGPDAVGAGGDAGGWGGQHLLFDHLPETEPRRPRRPRGPRAQRSAAAAAVSVDAVREPVPQPPGPLALPQPVRPTASMPPSAAFDPAALTNPELRALVQALPDARLAHLLVEAARELKRRVAPDQWDEAEDGPFEPDRALLRAATQAVGELSGEDL